ncbi:glutathione S-transferase [Psychromonas sp. psych-6C06]|uniref:glutathione S-transferase family protein n=1 Tax=Psychromonas sp. psych-6C06 TaxID=2058089 RepID=UPI000C32A119|nr:glutathione S-transferase family protein [Psychromonas sp. psych-6C06]PKF63674.1 glutathione S-transferase [Psychromonas sp. psych-6C06]
MKIYGSFTSPFVRHCRIALLETELSCEFIETDATQSATISPTKKVPLLVDGDLTLTDSSSILRYLREKSGTGFMADIVDFELFNMTNTVMDASVNIFFLEKFDNITAEQSQYLSRQKARVLSGLEALNEAPINAQLPLSDGLIRLACFLDWGIYRERINLKALTNLTRLLDVARTDKNFIKTAPPIDG